MTESISEKIPCSIWKIIFGAFMCLNTCLTFRFSKIYKLIKFPLKYWTHHTRQSVDINYEELDFISAWYISPKECLTLFQIILCGNASFKDIFRCFFLTRAPVSKYLKISKDKLVWNLNHVLLGWQLLNRKLICK